MEDLILANKLKLLAASLATAGLLAACGGGGGADTTPKAKVTSVKVMGDSLADSGTFGFKFTVQGSVLTGTGSTLIWPERIADQFSKSLCAYYRAGDENLTTYQEVSNCTNYAVGGGRVNPLDAPTSPKSVLVQIQTAATAGFSAEDLVIIDGRNHYPQDLEYSAQEASKALRTGFVAAFSVPANQLPDEVFADAHSGLKRDKDDTSEQLVIVGERAPGAHKLDMGPIADDIRAAIAVRHGVTVRDVLLTPAGAIPRTSSGKIGRRACRSAYLDGSLRMATGLSAKVTPEQVKVTTPTTVIGVRGTDFIVEENP